MRGEGFRALLDDVAHPVERLDVVDQRWPAEQPDLARKGGLVPRQAALALDRLQHRGFLAADIGAGAPPEINPYVAIETSRRDFGDFAQEEVAYLRVLVAKIDVDGLRLDRPCADQHSFEEAVRIGLEVVAVLEGAGLALVGVDGHQARTGFRAHEAPLAPGREPGPAESAQARIFQGLEDVLDRAHAGKAIREKSIAAFGPVAIEVHRP